MSLCLFLTARADRGLSATATADLLARSRELARDVATLRKLVVHVPASTGSRDPFLAPENPPVCVLQAYFDTIGHLEGALEEAGPLAALFDANRFPMLTQCVWTQQATAVREYSVAAPRQQDAGDAGERCSYLVSYEGPADNFHAWLRHYLREHAPLLAQLPDVREVEIYTRVDYCSDLRVARTTDMQRNKVVFDNAAALTRSLNSPVREALRADFEVFPPFSGASPHYPMQSFVTFVRAGIEEDVTP